MANDPWFKKVASLLPLNVAGSDADWRSLVGYADLTSSVSVELGSALAIVGAPTIATVGGRSAMLLNGSSAIYFTLTAGLNYMHTIVFEVYVASTGIAGFVKGEDGNPRARKVFAYSHETGALLGSTVSDSGTGAFFIAVPERAFVVALDDDASAHNAIVYDRLDPV